MKAEYPSIKPANWEPPAIVVIGIGTSPGLLAPDAREWIARAEIITGGKRHLDFFPDYPGERILLTSPLSEYVEKIGRSSAERRTVVLASGDPLFFGIGRRLLQKFGPERLIFHPNVTSVQALCARICEPWDGIATLSFHGRGVNDAAAVYRVIGLLERGGKVAVFTDPVHTPGWIGRMLVESGCGDCSMVVGEDIGSAGEKIREMSPTEAIDEEFSGLNLVLLRPPRHRDDAAGTPARKFSDRVFGFSEDAFEREAGLITKMEVRAVALAMLGLAPDKVLWDLGAATGSVSIEAARIAALKGVYAVEKSGSRYSKLVENIRNFRAFAVEPIRGEAPGALADLPDPDRVFIGGTGKDLPGVLDAVSKRLRPGGGVVHAIVLLQTLEKVKNFWMGQDFDLSITQVQVSRSAPTGSDLRMEALNPVFILSAWRKM